MLDPHEQFAIYGSDPQTLARRSDPPSSKTAAEKHAHRESNCAKVWHAVREYPGRTYRELAEFIELDVAEIGKRLADLRNTGRVVNGPERQCTVGRKPMQTWNIV